MSLPKLEAQADAKQRRYREVMSRLASLLEGETDVIAAMATTVCELHQAFDYFDWTGFYRVVAPGLLKIGPYQGGHGCLSITFDRGVCGAAARSRETQIVDDVHTRTDHIACATSTQSEIVVPVCSPEGEVMAVLDVDSNNLAAFDLTDQLNLQRLCARIGALYTDADGV